MPILVTDCGATLKVVVTVPSPPNQDGAQFMPQTAYLSKYDLSVKSLGTTVILKNSVWGFEFPFGIFTTPSGTSAAAVAAAIEALLDTPSFSVSATLLSSENFIGKTGGVLVKIANTITTSNNVAYASGDNIGNINTIVGALRVSGGSGFISDIEIWDKNAQNAPLIIDYWDLSPSGTYTDNAPEVIAGDEAKHLGTIAVAAGDYITTGAVSRVSLKGINLPIVGNGSANIFFTIATTGTPTYLSISALTMKHGIIQY